MYLVLNNFILVFREILLVVQLHILVQGQLDSGLGQLSSKSPGISRRNQSTIYWCVSYTGGVSQLNAGSNQFSSGKLVLIQIWSGNLATGANQLSNQQLLLLNGYGAVKGEFNNSLASQMLHLSKRSNCLIIFWFESVKSSYSKILMLRYKTIRSYFIKYSISS